MSAGQRKKKILGGSQNHPTPKNKNNTNDIKIESRKRMVQRQQNAGRQAREIKRTL